MEWSGKTSLRRGSPLSRDLDAKKGVQVERKETEDSEVWVGLEKDNRAGVW